LQTLKKNYGNNGLKHPLSQFCLPKRQATINLANRHHSVWQTTRLVPVVVDISLLNGADGSRTRNLLLAEQTLARLSYGPYSSSASTLRMLSTKRLAGLEPATLTLATSRSTN
jgi:hypothetical protein